jgi:hypothetical protein
MQEGQSRDDGRYLQGSLAYLSTEGRSFSHRLRRFMDAHWVELRTARPAAGPASAPVPATAHSPQSAHEEEDHGEDQDGGDGVDSLLVRHCGP